MQKIFYFQDNTKENLLSSIDVLLKPTRQNNPWGRDIQSSSYGKPVISIGTYKKFVETKKTGLLLKKYDVNKIARWLIDQENNKKNLKSYSFEAKDRIKNFCEPNKVSSKLIKVWNMNKL